MISFRIICNFILILISLLLLQTLSFANHHDQKIIIEKTAKGSETFKLEKSFTKPIVQVAIKATCQVKWGGKIK